MNEKKLKKGFYFGYGKNNFGEERNLSEDLVADLSLNEGCGIALISQKHIDFKSIKNKIKLIVENKSNTDVYIRIEKKLYNDVKTGLQRVKANSIHNDIVIHMTDYEKNEIKELVIAVLREDNEEKQYIIKTDIEI